MAATVSVAEDMTTGGAGATVVCREYLPVDSRVAMINSTTTGEQNWPTTRDTAHGDHCKLGFRMLGSSTTGGDVDRRYLEPPATGLVESWLRNTPLSCKYGLALREADGGHPASSANNGKADEHLRAEALAAERYYLVVTIAVLGRSYGAAAAHTIEANPLRAGAGRGNQKERA